MRAAFRKGDLMRTKTSVGLCLGFVALVAWTLPACSDDDDNGGTATGGAAGVGGSGGGTSGTSGAAGAAGSEFVCKTPGTNASAGNCTTQVDVDALEKCYEADGTAVDCDPDGGGTAKDIGAITGDCARSQACLGVTEPVANATCVQDCVQGVLGGKITPACTQCYAEAAACSKVNCITHCIVSGNPKCEPCQCACNCIQAAADCKGIPTTTCD
jgi:hypothetical protein